MRAAIANAGGWRVSDGVATPFGEFIEEAFVEKTPFVSWKRPTW